MPKLIFAVAQTTSCAFQTKPFRCAQTTQAVVTKLAPDFSGIDAVAADGSFTKVSLKVVRPVLILCCLSIAAGTRLAVVAKSACC